MVLTHKIRVELKKYYERKVAESKNKMLIINVLLAKIIVVLKRFGVCL